MGVGKSAQWIDGACLAGEMPDPFVKGFAARQRKGKAVDVVSESSDPAAIIEALDAAVDLAGVHRIEDLVREHCITSYRES